jgi:hypothetical protein
MLAFDLPVFIFCVKNVQYKKTEIIKMKKNVK